MMDEESCLHRAPPQDEKLASLEVALRMPSILKSCFWEKKLSTNILSDVIYIPAPLGIALVVSARGYDGPLRLNHKLARPRSKAAMREVRAIGLW